MSCSNCGTNNPEPFDCGMDGQSADFKGYWFLVKDGPVDFVGIEEDGELAQRFHVCETIEHPEPEEGEQVLCAECFDLIFPPEVEE